LRGLQSAGTTRKKKGSVPTGEESQQRKNQELITSHQNGLKIKATPHKAEKMNHKKTPITVPT